MLPPDFPCENDTKGPWSLHGQVQSGCLHVGSRCLHAVVPDLTSIRIQPVLESTNLHPMVTVHRLILVHLIGPLDLSHSHCTRFGAYQPRSNRHVGSTLQEYIDMCRSYSLNYLGCITIEKLNSIHCSKDTVLQLPVSAAEL